MTEPVGKSENLNGAGSTIQLWIDNQERSSDITFPVLNAEKGVVVHKAYGTTPELATKAVDSAQKAFLSWRDTTPWHRRTLLLEASKYLEQRRKELEDLILLEVPGPNMMAQGSISSSIDLLNELAGAISLATTGIVPHTRDSKTFAMVLKEPYGVHLGIAP